MRLDFARFCYGLLERSAVSIIRAAMSITQYRHDRFDLQAGTKTACRVTLLA
jgi:hypothetical protein